jgi:hypothetical protein
MYFNGFSSRYDAARAQRFRQESGDDTRQRAAALRHQHEQRTAELRARLPFTWQVGKVRPRYQGPSVWEHAPAAVHIQLLEPVVLNPGTKQEQQRVVGDWLCQAALDTNTGEVRYEAEAAPWYSDSSGRPAATYLPSPTCKRCLKRAEQYPKPP